ncbi:MAG: hypothetical protein NTZ01_04085 [Verrucomicrobia bacterium]|nr:hypothetical protein [Verrucomicrobiota bacterium]
MDPILGGGPFQAKTCKGARGGKKSGDGEMQSLEPWTYGGEETEDGAGQSGSTIDLHFADIALSGGGWATARMNKLAGWR